MNRVKQTAIKIFLITGFACLGVAIITPLLAQIQLESAEKLIAGYLWKDAEKKLELAAKIDPSDSQYPAALGEFLFTQAGYKDNRAPLLKRAEGYYRRAVLLDPRRAEYFVKLGQIDISLFMDEPGLAKKTYIEKAFENFRKAIENDPNGFNTAYAVGYSGLSAWKYLDKNERTIVIDRLKFSLKQKPWYREYIYPRLLRETGDRKLLETVMPEVDTKQWVDIKKIEVIKEHAAKEATADNISRSAWQGEALGGGDVYENGNMYWSGTMYGPILLPKGNASIGVEAKGSPAGGIYPYMLISLDGKKIGGAYVDSVEYKKYSFAVDTGGGVKVLGVTFTNDACDKTEDRNLYIGGAQIEIK